MQHLEEIASHAAGIAVEAGKIALSYFRQDGLGITNKQDDSPVTKADQETEQFIRHELAAAFPDHGILGEEFGTSGELEDQFWTIDPIDGTRFFITGYPSFGVLMSLHQQGMPCLGIVRMPALDETFIGFGKEPALLNGKKVKCSGIKHLGQAKLFINEAERTFKDNPERFNRLCDAGQTRRMSYDCYPHAMVAAGYIDAVTDMGLQPYDYLPLVPLIQSAGGIITDWDGKPLGLHSDGRVVTAATPELHEELLAVLA